MIRMRQAGGVIDIRLSYLDIHSQVGLFARRQTHFKDANVLPLNPATN